MATKRVKCKPIALRTSCSPAFRPPIPWGIGARVQRINTQLDIAEFARAEDPRRAQRSLTQSSYMLEECGTDWAAWSAIEGDAHPFRSTLLGLRLTAWRVALLSGDLEAAIAARSSVWSWIGPWILPCDRDKIVRFERASAAAGLWLEDGVPSPTTADRASLRPAR